LYSFWWNHKLRTEAGEVYAAADAPEDVRKAFQPSEHTDFRYRQYTSTKVHLEGEPAQQSQAARQSNEPGSHKHRGKSKSATASRGTSASAAAGAGASASASTSAVGRSSKDSGAGKRKGKGKSQSTSCATAQDKGSSRSAGAERRAKKQAKVLTDRQTLAEELVEAANASSLEEDLEEGVQESLWEVVPALSALAPPHAAQHEPPYAHRKQAASTSSHKRLRTEEWRSSSQLSPTMAADAQVSRTQVLQELRSMLRTELPALLTVEVQKLLQEVRTLRDEQQRLHQLQEMCKQQVQECLKATQSLQQHSAERQEERHQLQELCQQYARIAQRMPDQNSLARLASLAEQASHTVHSHETDASLPPSRSVPAAPSSAASPTSPAPSTAASAPGTARYAQSSLSAAALPTHGQPMPMRSFPPPVQQPTFSPVHPPPPPGAAAMPPHWPEQQEFSHPMPLMQEQHVPAHYVAYASSSQPPQAAAQPWAQAPPQMQQVTQYPHQYAHHMAGTGTQSIAQHAHPQPQWQPYVAQQQQSPAGSSAADRYHAVPPYAPQFSPSQ
jgi:hypothetical protein